MKDDKEYDATVTANADPDQKFRLKIKCPHLAGNQEMNWVRPKYPSIGSGGGFLYIPAIGDKVRISFYLGDPLYPEWSYSRWEGTALPDWANEDYPNRSTWAIGNILITGNKQTGKLRITNGTESFHTLLEDFITLFKTAKVSTFYGPQPILPNYALEAQQLLSRWQSFFEE
jgi:uncharacterized protein involved in type VI secretion and phage assembly